MAIAELWERLNQDPPGTHQFYPGADDAALRAVESALKAHLPGSYRSWLRLTNGALLFGDVPVFGVGDASEELELSAFTRSLQEAEPPLPPQLLAFSPDGDGAYCFVTRGGLKEGEYAIVFWSPEEGQSDETHDSFDEWLFELTEALRGPGETGHRRA